MQKAEKNRMSVIDILKGIGIASIVIGHSCEIIPGTNFKIAQFVYSYHIMVFLFVAGFCFKREYSQDPFGYVGKRLKSVLGFYFGYSVVFILAHNFLSSIHMLPNGYYTIDNILSCLSGAITFKVSESLLGTFWFIPMFLFANILFCFIFSFAEKMKYSKAIHIICCFAMAILGLYANTQRMFWDYNLQTAILGIPIIYFGYFVKLNWNYISRYINIIISILCAVIINYILSMNIGIIELSVDWIINQWLFYPVTILGIYFCLGISKTIDKITLLRRLFINIGQNSFHIMALHFLMFKIVDQIYGRKIKVSPEIMEKFPHAFELWYIYWLTGILGPLILVFLVKKAVYVIKTVKFGSVDKYDKV